MASGGDVVGSGGVRVDWAGVVGSGVTGSSPIAMSAQPRKFSWGPQPTQPRPVSGSIPHVLPGTTMVCRLYIAHICK